jgi:endonuclease/exonuclease/phosphatase family metal-dependent hydrolase
VRAVTFNIQHGAQGLDRVSSFLRTLLPDIVFLQEVDRECARSGGLRQAEKLAGELGHHAAFGEAFPFDSGTYGIALLCRIPLEDVQVIRLPHWDDGHGEPRILLLAHAGSWTLACTHLGLTGVERVEQARAIRGGLKGAARLILAGDINEGPGGPVCQAWSGWLQDSFAEAGGQEEPTAPPEGPPTRIDTILRGIETSRPVSARVGPPGLSDHRAVIVDFEGTLS